MRNSRKLQLVAAVLFLELTAAPLSAISPSAVLVYGGHARDPLVLRPAGPLDYPAFGLLWWRAGAYNKPTAIDPKLWTGLKARPYVSLAIFWGRYDANQLKPEAASQHGRFYPPTATDPAIIVTTMPDMQMRSNPIPTDLDGFYAAWLLSPQDLSTLKSLGFPSS
jgi:hypothetical protein